ncbi:MAG: site-2 protease family protein [Zoogloeaceae bacterium]|jgi:Zn-dependent protease|nr:site-2 protease family protein [Zoogloeaceae bacterium]
MDDLIQTIVIAALPVLFAITLHEAAHAYAARFFGDTTAARLGRISLNPLRHIDPFGTVLLPIALLLISKGTMAFGWAKPVPVDFERLRHPKRDMRWVAAAGPMANLVMALLWAMLQSLVTALPLNLYTKGLLEMGGIGVVVNLIFMFLNLIPLPPLDGGRIVVSLLPDNLSRKFARLEPFGFIILLALLFSGVLWKILEPLIGVAWLFLRFLFPVF